MRAFVRAFVGAFVRLCVRVCVCVRVRACVRVCVLTMARKEAEELQKLLGRRKAVFLKERLPFGGAGLGEGCSRGAPPTPPAGGVWPWALALPLLLTGACLLPLTALVLGMPRTSLERIYVLYVHMHICISINNQ